MKIAIIADDLTGANDAGVQLARQGVSTSVLLEFNRQLAREQEAIVLDTDSRSVTSREAYRRVTEAGMYIRGQTEQGTVYKKVDSTMRGNLGSELDAMYDVFQPDFVVLAPSFPQMGRIVRDGRLYVNGVPLHETDTARDPKNPVNDCYLPSLLKEQTARPIASIALEQLQGERERLLRTIKDAHHAGVPYLLFDAETESDLQQITDLFHSLSYRVIWWGSAGLANALSHKEGGKARHGQWKADSIPAEGPALIVVGSVSSSSRKQLDSLLLQDRVAGVEMRPEAVLSADTREKELERVVGLAVQAVQSGPYGVVLYSSGRPEEVDKTQLTGSRLGLGHREVSDQICQSLGRAASRVITQCGISQLVLTGGDTAKQVCLNLGALQIDLIDEVETGVPLGKIHAGHEIRVVTKAGGFGSDEVLIHSLNTLKGGRKYGANHRDNDGGCSRNRAGNYR